MIVVPIKEGENIERALKKFKRKFEKTGTIKELRGRQAYVKPSVKKRQTMMRAVYIQKLQDLEDQDYTTTDPLYNADQPLLIAGFLETDSRNTL